MVTNAANTDTPVFGVCFGHQLIAHVLLGDGTVRLANTPEVGFLTIHVTKEDPLMHDLPPRFNTFVSHADEVVGHHPDMELLARSERCDNHAFRIKEGYRSIVCWIRSAPTPRPPVLQWHPLGGGRPRC